MGRGKEGDIYLCVFGGWVGVEYKDMYGLCLSLLHTDVL